MNLRNRIEVAARVPAGPDELSDGDLIARVEQGRGADGNFTFGASFKLNPESFQDPEFPRRAAMDIEDMAIDIATFLGRYWGLARIESQ